MDFRCCVSDDSPKKKSRRCRKRRLRECLILEPYLIKRRNRFPVVAGSVTEFPATPSTAVHAPPIAGELCSVKPLTPPGQLTVTEDVPLRAIERLGGGAIGASTIGMPSAEGPPS